MQTDIDLLFRIEEAEIALASTSRPEADSVVQDLEALIRALPTPLREQYEWLRTWTRYPIARLRGGACTGCGASYPPEHAFLCVTDMQLAYCDHCMRILLLRDLRLVRRTEVVPPLRSRADG